MNKSVEARIEQLRLASQSHVNQLQIETAPFLADKWVKIEYRPWIYVEKGITTRRNVADEFAIFKVDGLRFIYNSLPKKLESKRGWLADMVRDKVVYPFLLFGDGELIPWSRIELLKDYNYEYLLIHGYKKTRPELRQIKFNIIEFPCQVRYGEDDDILPENEKSVGLYFGPDGKLTMGDEIAYRLEIIDPLIYAKFQFMDDMKQYIEFNLENKMVTPSSIIVFKDGSVYPKGTEELRESGWNVYTDFINTEPERYKYLTIYNERTSDSVSHQYTPCIDHENNYRVHVNALRAGGAGYLNKLFALSKFDFTLDPKKFIEENMTDVLSYIINYNANLLDDAYKDETDIFTESYDAKYILDRAAANNGIFAMSRKRHGHYDCHVTMYVNGAIYKHSDRIMYVNNMVRIPIIDIDERDKIEFVFHTNIDNNILNSIIIEDGVPVTITGDINQLHLFSMEKHGLDYDVFEVDPLGRTQFEIYFEYKKVGDQYIITLDDPWYYGHVLTMISDRQMRYCRIEGKDIRPFVDSDYYFLLPTDFNYCHDKSHYLVMINGRTISQDNFTVTITSRTRPFDKLYLYLACHLEPEDYVDVFYMPTPITQALWVDNLELSGDIVVDCSELEVPLSTKNYFIFVDGLKVHPDDVINISRNKIRITTSYKSLHNVLLMRYNHSLPEIEDIFRPTIDDEWSRYIDSLEPVNLNLLIGNSTSLKDTENTNTATEFYDLSTIVSDIVVDYYIRRAGLNLTNKAFVYDFEPDAVVAESSTGIDTLTITDANKYDKMHQYWSNYTEDEVKDVQWAKSPIDS